MKIATTILAAAIVLGTAHGFAGPGSHGLHGGGLCAPLAQFETDTNGTVTAAEFAAGGVAMVQALQTRLFAKYDTDSNGVITSAEAQAVNDAIAQEWLQRILDRFDANDDGSLSTNELRRGRHGLHGADLDANGDGTISGEELVAAAEAMAADLQAGLLAKYDTNQDGAITSDEALAVHQAAVAAKIAAILDRYDANHDGEVTSAEVAAVSPPTRGLPALSVTKPEASAVFTGGRGRKAYMKLQKVVPSMLFAALAVIALLYAFSVDGQFTRRDNQTRRDRFRHTGTTRFEGTKPSPDQGGATEAPTGFDNVSNGFDPQGPDFDGVTEDNVVPLRSFNDNRFVFEEVEKIADGLGPTYNAQSCRECHQNVVTGGASQITEHRTGRLKDGAFFESLGGSLIHSRATHPDIVEHVTLEDDVRTFRISTSTLGAGFVESIANETLLAIRDGQPVEMRGMAPMVPVLEGDGTARIGRFGWKCQHASLESFSADAYLNEMGITSPLFPEENTSSGRFVGFGSGFDPVPEPEDDGEDVKAFANFMRATKAPPRGAVNGDVLAGEQIFKQVGCIICHVQTITTAPTGTAINGGALTIPATLGNKIIHPYSDYLLHDIGSGDGIPVLPTPQYAATAAQMRTAPLWGMRTRNRLMHDGLSFTRQEAIQRHGGQAAAVTAAYNALSDGEKRQLLAFLDSL